MSGKLLIQALLTVLTVASLAAVGWYTYQAVKEGIAFSEMSIGWLVASALLHLLVVAVLPVMWVWLLGMVKGPADGEIRLSDPQLVRAYSRSWLARYVPGRVWMVGGRILYGRQTKISARAITASTVLEAGFSYSALGLLGIAFVVGGWVHWAFVPIIAAVGFAGFYLFTEQVLLKRQPEGAPPSRFAAILAKATSWLHGSQRPTRREVLAVMAVFWLHAGVQLAFFTFIALAVSTFSGDDAFLLAGAWGVGASIGYLSIFSAGGLGIRDGVALALIGPALSGPLAGTVVATARVILVLADLLLVAVAEAATFIAVHTKRLRNTGADGVSENEAQRNDIAVGNSNG